MRFALVTLLSTTLATAAAAQTPQGAPTGGRAEMRQFASAAGARSYRLYVPASVEGRDAVPLVVMLHGCLQDAADIARGTRLDAHAERLGVIVAYPEQPATANPRKCWNWFDASHQRRDAGEPALIAGLTREVLASHPVDAARVYVGGISAGGAMAAIVAAAYPELFAAVGVHSGVAVGVAKTVPEALAVMAKGPAATPTPLAQVPPLWVLHGGKDAVLNVQNAHALVAQWGEGAVADASLVSGDGQGWRRIVRHDASGRVRSDFTVVTELGHAWSGGDKSGTFTDEKGPDASALMLAFFLAQRKAAAQ